MIEVGDVVACPKWEYDHALVERVDVVEDGRRLLSVSQGCAGGCVYEEDCTLVV